ncbi:hypothetical protein I3843_07G059500, partial [Carya illinoinensis]
MEIQHFSHNHPLTDDIYEEYNYDRCQICGENFEWSYDHYGCDDCHFYIHKSCAKYSHELQHPSHPHHLLLKLSHMEPCANCSYDVMKFKYSCSHCNKFYLCPKCAFLPPTKKAENHDHPLTLIQTLSSFTSDHCLKEGNGMPYFCPTYLFMVHPEYCALLPSIVKVIRHKHPLRLIYSLPADQSKRRVCQLCAKPVDMNSWVYCCSKIQHFSHEHYLKLTDELGIDEKCDGCMQSILPPFYACAQCRFFLHKSCVELLRELRNSLHQHPLKLLLREKKPFRCDACALPCNGFDYRCDECDFDLDVQCSLMTDDILTHPSHEQHLLILARSSEEKMCNSCRSKSKHNFHCVDCEFTLDFKCFKQPHTFNYEEHDHPFTLCYTPEDASDEYYCDICEEKRDPKCWFYYCADCSYPAHLECILGQYQNLKFGKTFKYDIHQHPLALVQKTSRFLKCDNIANCIDLTYECAECNFILLVLFNKCLV